MQLIHDGMQEMRPYVTAYGVWALFLVLYLESLGAPLPGESALVASALPQPESFCSPMSCSLASSVL